MDYLQNNLENFRIIFNCLKKIYSNEYNKISFENIFFDDFLQKKLLVKHIEDVLECMCNFFDDYSFEEEEMQEKKVKESLKLKEEKGFKYFIDNQLTYYYFDDNNLFQGINFEYMFKKKYICDYDCQVIKKIFDEETAEYFFHCFIKKLKENI